MTPASLPYPSLSFLVPLPTFLLASNGVPVHLLLQICDYLLCRRGTQTRVAMESPAVMQKHTYAMSNHEHVLRTLTTTSQLLQTTKCQPGCFSALCTAVIPVSNHKLLTGRSFTPAGLTAPTIHQLAKTKNEEAPESSVEH